MKKNEETTTPSSTKNLGGRSRLPIRLGPQTMQAAIDMAKLANVPVNAIVALSLTLLRATMAPLIDREVLSLDQLEEEVRVQLEDARRVVAVKKAQPRK